jgi:fructose-1,6-bisphosphatase/inositol monophosphatase family enzyme
MNYNNIPSEETIIGTIRSHFPGHSFLAEESLREEEGEGGFVENGPG